MDSLTTAAARALAAGDPLGALTRVALREDAPALALRGIAMAQLGELERARLLVRRAARAFGGREPVARARCLVAEAEIALASRDLDWPAATLDAARAVLEARGDRVHAELARLLAARRLLVLGRIDDAERALDAIDRDGLPPASLATAELVAAGIALRQLRTVPARQALARARTAARRAGIASLVAETDRAAALLTVPAARLVTRGHGRLLLLEDVETLLASGALVVDACRYVIRHGGVGLSLARRPVLFALARALAEAWPGDAPRDALIAAAFGGRQADESHRARLRVEAGRLRALLREIAVVEATADGFAIRPRQPADIVVLAPPVDDAHADVLALLSDGEAWASSALALALDASQRSVQRALESLAASGRVQAYGRGRARRWTTPPLPGITTTLLLPAPLPGD